MKFFLWKN